MGFNKLYKATPTVSNLLNSLLKGQPLLMLIQIHSAFRHSRIENMIIILIFYFQNLILTLFGGFLNFRLRKLWGLMSLSFWLAIMGPQLLPIYLCQSANSLKRMENECLSNKTWQTLIFSIFQVIYIFNIFNTYMYWILIYMIQ